MAGKKNEPSPDVDGIPEEFDTHTVLGGDGRYCHRSGQVIHDVQKVFVKFHDIDEEDAIKLIDDPVAVRDHIKAVGTRGHTLVVKEVEVASGDEMARYRAVAERLKHR